MEVPRYLKEYATARRKAIRFNELMQERYKELALRKIDRILSQSERGFITIDEAMEMLVNLFDGIAEAG